MTIEDGTGALEAMTAKRFGPAKRAFSRHERAESAQLIPENGAWLRRLAIVVLEQPTEPPLAVDLG